MSAIGIAHIQPTGSKVLIQRDKAAETVGSLLIPYSARKPRENVRTGTVIAVGPGAISKKTGRRVPPPVHVGDRVLYPFNAGHDFEDGYSVMEFTDIQAILAAGADSGIAFAGAVEDESHTYLPLPGPTRGYVAGID